VEVFLYGYLFTVGNVAACYKKRETALIPRYTICSGPLISAKRQAVPELELIQMHFLKFDMRMNELKPILSDLDETD
jgi:hypothetical protein